MLTHPCRESIENIAKASAAWDICKGNTIGYLPWRIVLPHNSARPVERDTKILVPAENLGQSMKQPTPTNSSAGANEQPKSS
ncbi:hypothetical protein GOZ97_15395 [Agrobacterium vitis]|uniref:hypothetical protein n=1 Tax=Rhizobium/Agrobacterium group TaxID=227290 RepID=UPI0008FB1600|nr:MULTISPECIES: hypothetical protein [Rhizobium/Agrobacterium group]MCF1433546.1 hypothetical protein [Allorhizobium ampelinum]MCF1470857.1 hypothetical protein [Allorhizobium ampelinum]MUO90779.1 hypothetical protein [Agrobacterium vitis]MUZ54140.1 hypothetical protein [Agrobacterium vitis]MUZ92814.1 hypothetical protein [Agrobacterium vitis]